MKSFNIHMAGVGGQGIGLLSEVLIRAADHAGLTVKGVDTHGLSQRGGIVISQMRIGPTVQTPLIAAHDADLIVALERHEALRAVNDYARNGAVLVYYDTVWQPLEVRMKESPAITTELVQETCRQRNISVHRVQQPDLPDTRMQNMVVLAAIDRAGLITGITNTHYRQALGDLLDGRLLENNLAVFTTARSAV